MKPESKKDCECGKKKYGYRRGKAKFYICFTCGKFDGHDFNEKVYHILVEEPHILFHLLKSGYLKPMR